MTKSYTTIIIDPVSQTINYAKHDGGYETTLEALSFAGHVCVDMESYKFHGPHFICVDGSAAFEARLPSFSITTLTGAAVTFYGRAMIVRSTPTGNPANVKVVISEFIDRITWGDPQVAMMWKLSEGSKAGGVA